MKTRPSITQLLEIVEKEPGNANAWFELAGEYDFQGKEAEALPFYEKTLELIESLKSEDHPRTRLAWLLREHASAAVR